MNWKGITLFFALLVASFGLSLRGYSPREISLPISYPLETERVQISGTDFSMQILKEFTAYESEDEDNPSTRISPPYFSSYLPRFEVYPVKLGWAYTKVFFDPETFGTSASDPREYMDLNEYNIDGIRMLIGKPKNRGRDYDYVASAWVIHEDQVLGVYGWGPVTRTDDIYRMLETMLLTLRVETEE